jgi:uncharacterized protein (DUF488 family)
MTKKPRKASSPLFTIGYEKATSPAFLTEMKDAGIALLVDVRAVAASRRPGFAKRALSAGLDDNGIDYLHLQKLGTPTEGRVAARRGDHKTMLRIYEKHLKTAAAQEQLDELTSLVKAGRPICILCYERDPHICHRLRIAELICERCDVAVEHLAPKLF